MYAIWQHPRSGNRYAVEIHDDNVVMAYGPIDASAGRTIASIQEILDSPNMSTLILIAEWITTQMRSYTQRAEGLVVCNDCGAYAATEEGVQHLATCKPGESAEWREFFGNQQL